MLYKNISDEPVWILQSMVKTLIRPGETINLNVWDIKHSGSSMRFFESLEKHNIVQVNGWHKVEHKEENKQEPVIEPVIEAPIIIDAPSIKETVTEAPAIEAPVIKEIVDVKPAKKSIKKSVVEKIIEAPIVEEAPEYEIEKNLLKESD